MCKREKVSVRGMEGRASERIGVWNEIEGMEREAGRWDKRRKEKREVIREGREKKEWERSAEE